MEDRKQHMVGYLLEDSTECESKTGVSSSSLGQDSNTINGFKVGECLLERILDKRNFKVACNKVIQNKGIHGVDGMSVYELSNYLNINGMELKQALLDGKYKPSPVLRVEIPKGNGKYRKIGIPTAVDRVIQQAIAQVLVPIYEPNMASDLTEVPMTLVKDVSNILMKDTDM